MSDLTSAVIGTKLRLPADFGSSFSILTVDRITASSVFAGAVRLDKLSGKVYGSSGYRVKYAHIASDTDIVNHRLAVANRALKELQLSRCHLELAEQFIITVKDGNAR